MLLREPVLCPLKGMLSFKVLRVQSRTEGDLEALHDRRRLPLLPDFFFPAKETTKPTHHGGHRFVSGSRVLISRPYWTACFSWKRVLRFVGGI
jgi:hypothetical protein